MNDTNKRQCKCGRCEKIIKKGDGIKQWGNTTKKSYFVCQECWNRMVTK